MTRKPALSDAARALAVALTHAPSRERLRAEFHPTLISRWKNGHVRPDLQSAFRIEDLTGGRVKARWWLTAHSEAA